MTFAFNIAKKSTFIPTEINPLWGHPDFWMTQ
jgi:hypothetical protein